MVLHKTIHHLKQRPHQERRAVAMLSATFVVVMLFFGWAYAFFSGIRATEAVNQAAMQTAAANESAQNAHDLQGSQPVSQSTETNSGQ